MLPRRGSPRSGRLVRAAAHIARLVAVAGIVALTALGLPRVAFAAKWVELRVVKDDVRIELLRDGAGRARVEHRIVFLVSGGPLTSIVVEGVDADAAPDPEGQVVPREIAQTGGTEGSVPATVKRIDVPADPSDPRAAPRTDLEVVLDGGAGVSRGAYVLTLRYATDLAAGGGVSGEGPIRVVRWMGPRWADGLDATRATFVVPAAPTAPSVVDPGADDGGEGPIFLGTLRRTTASDELEILKPYAPRGERVTWSARVDARALGGAAPAAAPAETRPRAADEPLDRLLRDAGLAGLRVERTTLLALGGALLAIAWALLVAAKGRQAVRTHAASGARPRPLAPLPLLVRAPASAALLVAGLWLESTPGGTTNGALLVVAAALLAAHRAPRFKAAPRGPGRWLPVSAEEAFAPPRPVRGAWLDASTRSGALVFAALVLAVVGAGVAIATVGLVHRGVLVAMQAAALFPIFLTGRVADLPPDPATAPARLLRDVGRRVEAIAGRDAVRAVPRIRVPRGGADADDLRLALVPTRPHPGFRGVAVGVTHGLGAFGWVALPEILVRVQIGSPAERALAPVARRARAMEGARDDERVLSFVPRLPTARVTAALAAAVVARVILRPGESEASAPGRRAAPARAAA